MCDARLNGGTLVCQNTDPEHEPHKGCIYIASGASHLLHEHEDSILVHGGDDW